MLQKAYDISVVVELNSAGPIFFGSQIFFARSDWPVLLATPRKIPCLPARKSLPLPVTQEFFIVPIGDVIGCHYKFTKSGKWCLGVVNLAQNQSF